MMKKNLFVSGVGAVALLLAGCTNVATFDYAAAPGAMVRLQEAGSAAKTIAVMPFMDQRGARYADPSCSAGDSGSLYWGFFPLMPFGYLHKEEPENGDDFVSLGRFHFNPQNDLADAAILSLRTSNLFASVKRANNLKQADTDYIWRGTVTSTYYGGYMYSYCITYLLSHVLWIIGAPSGTSVNELGVKFELVDRATGKVLWNYEYRGSESIVHWIYARIGRDVSLYPQLMKQAMNSALIDLSQKLPALQQ